MNHKERTKAEDCEYESKKCNACELAVSCDKVEIWNSMKGPYVAKAGTFEAIYNDDKGESGLLEDDI